MNVFDSIQNTIGSGNYIPSGINMPTRPANVSDAQSRLRSTINRYNG